MSPQSMDTQHPKSSQTESIKDKPVGILQLTTGDAAQKKIAIPAGNIAFLTEPQLGQPGRCLALLKAPPTPIAIAQPYETVCMMLERALNDGGTVNYTEFESKIKDALNGRP